MQNIEKLLEQFKSILIAEQYIKEVEILLQNKKEERKILIASVDAIADTLEDHEEFSLRNLFKETLVNEEEQHEIEKQEYLLLALKYKDCTEVINILEFEYKILVEKIEHKEKIESALTQAIEAEKLQEQDLMPSQIKRLVELSDAIKDCINLKREIYEANLVAEKIKETLSIMLDYLYDAKRFDRWGEFYAEIQEGKARKKAYMDQAHRVSHEVGFLMQKLKSELYDIFVYKSKTKMVSYEELLNFQAGFHESMITDWVVSNDVISALETISSTDKYIQRIINSLEAQKEKIDGEMKQFIQKRNTIVEAI